MEGRNGDCRETGSGVEIARRYAGSSKISRVVPWRVRVSYLLQAEPCVIVSTPIIEAQEELETHEYPSPPLFRVIYGYNVSFPQKGFWR
jgi:hypothetical protein